MQMASNTKKNQKNNPLSLAVLNLPTKSSLIEMPSPASEYNLVHHSRKKINLAVYKIQIPRSKLFTNLQTYEWRYQTDFPVVKTCFVSVKGQMMLSPNIIDVQVLIEHCPLRLKHIYEITVGQSLYLLKECIVGFERLFNRYGGFDVTENMISINEKGFCRVWMNENFAINSFHKNQNKETKMVQKIINLIQCHSCDSKVSKRLFAMLADSTTFLGVLKTIQTFLASSKMLVPSKFIFLSSSKEIPKNYSPLMVSLDKNKFQNFKKNFRSSIKSPTKFKLGSENSKQKLLSYVQSSRRLQKSPLKIKRFKSEDKILPSILKASDGETAYTRNLFDAKKSSNKESLVSSPKNAGKIDDKSKGTRTKWIEQSSFFIGIDQSERQKQEKPSKKQLTHSQAFNFEPESPLRNANRKYSINVKVQKNGSKSPPKKFYQVLQKQENDNYITQFSSLLHDESEKSNSLKKINEDEDEKERQKHLEDIIKNNGWSNGFSALLNNPRQLKESIHAGGEEENIANRDIKLEKLGKMGRRGVAMSILPEEYEEYF